MEKSRARSRSSDHPTPVLATENLTISRDGTRILHGLTWSVAPGEHWAILGANGSGKTSLLAALTAYLTPTSGEIHLLGETFGETDWRLLRERVGIVSSAIRQRVPDWDSAELVVIGGKYAMLDYWGRVKKSDRTAALRELRRVGCGHLAAREWGVLSQGERQRVLIARALIAGPAVLILDEPCAGLDPVAREKFLALVQRLSTQRRSPSVIFVTHHIEEITSAFTHALILKNGRALAAGPIATTVNSANLSAAFGAPLRVRHSSGRWSLLSHR
jgi:iron complex transport system ATP-binding protein